MDNFKYSHVTVNTQTNEIKVNLDKSAGKEPYIHQINIVLDPKEAVKLIDQLKIALKSLIDKQ